jgi:hypothetical protein
MSWREKVEMLKGGTANLNVERQSASRLLKWNRELRPSLPHESGLAAG